MTNKTMRAGRTKAHFLIILALAAGLAGGYGCQKAALEPPAPTPSPAAAMRAAFETAGYDRALVRPLGDTAELCWVPNWENSYDKTGTDGQRYTYVPLATKVRSTRTQQWRANVALVGARRFLVVRHGSGPDAFTLATYLDAPAQGNAAKRGAAAGPAQPRRFADFSGSLLLQGLSTPQFARFAYRNGQVVHQGAGPVKGQPGEPTRTTNAYSCVDLYTCYWIAYCNSSTASSTNVTMTAGVNGCDDPVGEACYDVYGVSWQYNGSDIQQQCTYEPDPPTNPTNPTNPGGGGGGIGDGTTTNPDGTTSIEVVLSGPKVDPKQENRCFDKSQGATVTVYVQQAVPNTADLNGGQHGVGHTSVGIEQNGITRYMGYYPQTGANQFAVGLGVNYPGELRDNSGEVYDVSITKPVTSSQLSSIITYMNNPPATYSLNNYNCADFGIAVGNLAGMDLPSTTTSAFFGKFNGRSPGELGQDVRGMTPPAGTSVNPNGGNAPTKQGTCP